MSITTYEMLEASSPEDLAAKVATAIGAGKQPFGPPNVAAEFNAGVVIGAKFYQAVVEGSASATFEDLDARIQAVEDWTSTFATKINADNTAQNLLAAFPLTLDTNYAPVA